MDKGTEDGLYISCVASSTNLWALIMDAGTGFSDQVYELSAVFLHKVSFMEYYCYLSNFICIPITGTTVNFDRSILRHATVSMCTYLGSPSHYVGFLFTLVWALLGSSPRG